MLGVVRKTKRNTRCRRMARMESTAMTVVFLCQRPDGDFQERLPGGFLLCFGFAFVSEELAGGGSKVVFIGGNCGP